MSRLHITLALLLGCGDEPAPQPEEAASTEVSEASTPQPETVVRSETFTPSKRWTPETIATLAPVVPSRTATTPAILPPSKEIDDTLAILRGVVERHGTDPSNPWAIGHALLANGPELELRNGEKAVEYLFSTYAETFEVGEGQLIRFPKKLGDSRVEPHTDLMLKALTESGVSPDRPVAVGGASFTVADLYRGAVIQSALDPKKNHSNYSGTNDMPWSLQALASWAPKDLQWQALDGTDMALDDLATFTLTVLVTENQELSKAMQASADFEKKGQGIFAYTCGGAHLLQGTTYASSRGFGTDRAAPILKSQAELMFYRLPRELEIYDALMQKAPQHTVLLLTQRLKFTGHFLESMHKLAAMGVYTPTPQQVELLEGAANQVVLATRALREQAAFEAMDALRVDNEQLYLDLIGDSAHAINGLLLARGERAVRY